MVVLACLGVRAAPVAPLGWVSGQQNTTFTTVKVQNRVRTLGCANKDLWALCAPIFIIVVHCKTATSYFLGGKE